MKHHRPFTISVDFYGTIVNEAFPGIGMLKKTQINISILSLYWRIYKRMEFSQRSFLELNINASSIAHCCRLKSKSAGKFIWRYIKKEKIEIMNNVKLKIKRVC